MPRGQPDFGMYAAREAAASISDLGELAARLGSIVTYDRRGDVLDLDDFTSPTLRWEASIIGAGGYIRFDSDNVKSGAQALKLHNAAVSGAYVKINKAYLIPGLKKMGVEVSFSQLSVNGFLIIYVYYSDGTTYYQTAIRFAPSAGELSFINSTNVWEVLGTLGSLFSYSSSFFTAKLVVDFDNQTYKRLIFATTEFDLSDEAIYSFPFVLSPMIYVQLELRNAAVVANSVWLDDVVITRDEP